MKTTFNLKEQVTGALLALAFFAALLIISFNAGIKDLVF